MTSGAMADLGYVTVPQGEPYEIQSSPADPCPQPSANPAVHGIDIASREIILDPVGRVE